MQKLFSMLGALLGALMAANPHDFLDARPIEDEAEDSHWSNDKNRFEDWLLNDNAVDAANLDPGIYY